MSDDENNLTEETDDLYPGEGTARTMRGMSWISRFYEWMEDTHTETTRLVAWVAFVTSALLLFGLSPVLALIVVLIGIFRVKESGRRLDHFLNQFPIWGQVEQFIMVPLFGFYFLIALRFFEIDLGAVNLRPVSPFIADLVNFIGGSVLGFIVSRRSLRRGKEA